MGLIPPPPAPPAPPAVPIAAEGPARPVAPPTIRASIETLSLTGFPAVNTARLQTAFTTELTRLIAERAATGARWTPPTRADRLPPIQLAFQAAPSAATLGERLARAVFLRLTSEPEARS